MVDGARDEACGLLRVNFTSVCRSRLPCLSKETERILRYDFGAAAPRAPPDPRWQWLAHLRRSL